MDTGPGRWIAMVLALWVGAGSGCIVVQLPQVPGTPIDQLPMYGGMDRSAVPELRKADEVLISGTTGKFGSRRAAAKVFTDRGFEYYKAEDNVNAMRRFNQAWLIDDSYADVFWGFASVLHDRGEMCESVQFLERALELGQRRLLADLGKTLALCGVQLNALDAANGPEFIERSEAVFQEALEATPESSYLHFNWAFALLARGEYGRAWTRLERGEELGGRAPVSLLRELGVKMPRPSRAEPAADEPPGP